MKILDLTKKEYFFVPF